MCTTINRSRERPFGSDGCQVPVGNSICGETKTLDIINEFKRLYEEKMQEIDNTSCGDCLQEKIKLQQDWIGDLTEQNEMLVRAVEELEHEATERVKMLEEKLQRSAECICEAEKKSITQDSTIHVLEAKVQELDRVSRELQFKKEECDNLQKNMIDMRQALTEEVATKHDAVLKLKRECQELEDRCIQADKQVAFKDDIIKELRKEIKQLKQQITQEEVDKLNKTISDLSRTLEEGKRMREEEEKEQCNQISGLNNRIKELDCHLCKCNEDIKEKCSEIATLRRKLQETEKYMLNVNENTKKKTEEINILLEKIKEIEDRRSRSPCSRDVHEAVLLNDRIKELEICLGDLKSKMKLCKQCKQSLKVCFCDNNEVQTDANETADDHIEKLSQRDELIKFQAETLKMLEEEVRNLKEKENEWMCDKETKSKMCKDLECLNKQIELLNEKFNMSENRVKELDETLIQRDDLVKYQAETLKMLQEEVLSLKEREKEWISNAETKTKGCKDLECLEKQLNVLKEKLNTSESRVRELDEMLIQRDKTLRMLQEEIHSLQENNKETNKKSCRDLECLNKKIGVLKEKLDKSENKVKHLDEALIQRDDMLRMLQQEMLSLKKIEKESACNREAKAKSCKDLECLNKQFGLLKEKLCTSENRVIELDEMLKGKEEIIKTQKETLNCIEKQLTDLRVRERDMKIECEHQSVCIQQLKCKISELEASVQDEEMRASNLQTAVDLYTNTINVLEATEEKYKLEVEHQRITISNLQEALVTTKNEFESFKQKYDDSVSVGWASWFGLSEPKPTNNNENVVHDI